MNPPYAVAGADIEVGMTVILEPDGEPFAVSKVEPCESAESWLRLVAGSGFRRVVQKGAWYAEVEQS